MRDEIKKEEIIKEILSHSKKITEALYRITDLFPDKEPLKWLLRNESVQIFQLFVLFSNTNDLAKKFSCFEKISPKINQITHTLELASLNSFAANINFEVIKREYENINNIIINNKFVSHPLEDMDDLKLDTLSGHKTPLSLMSDINENINGHNNGNEITYKTENAEKKNIENNIIEEKEIINNEENVKREAESLKLKEIKREIINEAEDRNNNKMDKNLSERADKIISIIKEKKDKKASINEIFDFFNGISKKTIQRELAKLVFMGYLQMGGIKRWRIYKLSV